MADAWRIGTMGTDTLTGRYIRVLPSVVGPLNVGVGRCFQHEGADYQVTAGRTFYLTGVMVYAALPWQSYLEIRYADDAALTTNPVTMIGLPQVLSTAWTSPVLPIAGVTAAAAHYVGVFNNSAANQGQNAGVTIFGYEQ